MTHLIVLLMVVTVGASDGAPADLTWAPAWFRNGVDALRLETWPAMLAGFVLISAMQGVFAWYCASRLARTGRSSWIRRADRALALSQWCTVLWLGLCCFALGWNAQVREWVGDPILLDEAITLAPAVLALTVQWACFYPVERRLREATFFNRLDRGEPVHPVPTHLQYVSDQLRTHAGPTLVAALLLYSWVETVEHLTQRVHGRWARDTTLVDGIATAALFIGAITIVSMLPVLWRMLWRTRPLPPGALRDELRALCARHRVRVADLLVWETRGALLNGALIGVLPRLRYIMLTDALLERLSAPQVEAVMAHEIAHARHRHIPWLIATILVVIGLASALPAIGITRLTTLDPNWARAAGALGALVGAVLMLGWVSRRFEEQADAFAAGHLALVRAEQNGEADPMITTPDARGMSDALGAVALHNHIPVKKFSYRHGSIYRRQRTLTTLVGTPVARIPIDGLVRRLKVGVVVGGLTLGALIWWFPEAGALL